MGSLIKIAKKLAVTLPLATLVTAAALAQSPGTPPPRLAALPGPFDPRAAVDERMVLADNLVEFYHPKALGRFFAQWNARGHQISVVHLGDSHVQLGWLVAPIRQRRPRHGVPLCDRENLLAGRFYEYLHRTLA